MYKNIFWILNLFLLNIISNHTYAAIVPITAKISQPTDSVIGFSYKKTKNATKRSYFQMNLNAQGEARFELNIEGATFVEVHHGYQTVFVYLEEGDDLNLMFAGKKLFETIQFEGKGAKNNNAWAQYRQQFRSHDQRLYEGGYIQIQADAFVSEQANLQTAIAYAKWVDQQQQAQIQLLNRQQTQISPALYTFLKTEINYSNATNRIVWFLEHQYEDIQRSKKAIDVLRSVSLRKKELLEHGAYQNFLKAYLLYLYLPEDLSRQKVEHPLYQIASQQFTGKVKYFLQKELLYQTHYRSGDLDLGQKHFATFSNENSYPKYTEEVLSTYGGTLSGLESVAAPDFDMVDPNRNLIALGDYKGKVVYLSFWASWCKPCIEGFKKSASTRQQLQDMGVVLLNVSIDKKESAWREAMIRHNPTGINGLVLSLEDISKKYDISSIPLYQIIDKNGKFAYLSSNGQRNILDEFRRLVEQ